MKLLKALLVEDSNDDVALLLRHLFNEGFEVQSAVVQTAADMKAALAEQSWDIILSDYVMPSFTGLDALAILKESGVDIPIIIISGTIGEDIAVEAMLVGVNDYLLKDNLTRLAPAIEREIENASSRRAQQQAEETLRRSEASLANAQRIAHIGNFDWDIQHKQIFWSDEVYRILNLPKGTIEGSPELVYKYIHPDDINLTRAVTAAALSKAAPYEMEIRVVRPGGEERTVHLIGELKFDKSGEPLRLTATVQDITERKTSEAEMLLMKRAFDSITEGVLICDAKKPDNPTIYTNAAFENLTGYAFEEIEGRNCRILQGAETNRRTVDKIREALKKSKPFHGEILNYRKNGTSFWNALSISPVFNNSGNLTHFVGVQQDVSERKRIETALEEASRRERSMIENALDVICSVNANGEFVFVSPACLKIWGYSAEEMTGRRYTEFVAREDAAKTNEEGLNVMSGQATINFENRYRHKNGSLVEMRWSALWSEQEQLMFCVAHDITESRRAEEKLRQSETNLAAAQRITHLGSWEVQLSDLRRINNNKVVWSDEVYRIFGYQPEQIEVSINRYFDSIHPDDRKYSRRAFVELITGKKDLNIEFRVILPNGGERILHGLAEVVYDRQTNEPQKIIGTVQDITDRKIAEEALKQSERDYRTVFEQAHDAIIIFAPEGEIVLDVNRRACEIYGFSRPEFIGMSIETISKIPSNGKDKVKETLEAGEYLNFETVQFRKDGSEMSLEINASTITYQGRQAIITINRDVSERKHAEESLRKAETRYRSLVELSPAVVYLAQPYHPYSPIYVSPNVNMFGYEAEEWMSRDDMWLNIIYKEDRARVLRLTENAMSQGLDTELEYRILGRNGEIFWVHDKGSFITDESGEKIGWQGVILDITKTQALEEQLRQSQKLESVGRLAGGIAHDFNNMLTAINGYSELTLRRLENDDPLRRNIEEIKKAGERSADLTRQLLAFSRRQVLQPVVLNLNEIISDTTKMLQRLIGEGIQITTVLNPKVGRVKVDPGQFSQIVLNLAVNARDAMPQGGKLIIETVNIFLSPDYAEQHVAVLPGAYVMLAVSDTGTGMSAETKEHIFEPFFTTKDVGQGTGLGLATVYGIVKQSGGIIEVASEQGAGTTFKIYLPRVAEEASGTDIKDIPVKMPKGTETILLVEDEEMVRNLSRTILEECGYIVIEAMNGVEALEVCEKGDCEFHLLMTDVVMPKMGGRELADLLKEKLPDLQILFTSGYTDDAVVRNGVIEPGTNFIQKPFTPDLLAKKIRELLDSSEKSPH